LKIVLKHKYLCLRPVYELVLVQLFTSVACFANFFWVAVLNITYVYLRFLTSALF